MRILVVTKHLLDQSDAQAQQSMALLNAFVERGATLDVITGEVNASAAAAVHDAINMHILPAHWPTRKQTILAKVARKIDRNLSAWHATQWARSASKLITILANSTHYDALISIALPMESHIAMLRTQRAAPWIASLSDPWPESILPDPYSDYAIPVLSSLQERVVSNVLGTADAIVFPCEGQRDYIAGHYHGLDTRRTFVVPHVGPRMRFVDKNESGHAITLLHCGALSRERVCKGLAHALAMLPASSKLHLRCIGNVHPEMLMEFDRAGASSRVSIEEWIPKNSVLEQMRASNALLLIEARMKSYPFLPSKLADYASTGLPIVAITGESSPTAKLVREHSAGLIAHHDPQSIYMSLLSLEASYKELSSRSLSTLFDAENVVTKYYEIIDDLKMRAMCVAAEPSPYG